MAMNFWWIAAILIAVLGSIVSGWRLNPMAATRRTALHATANNNPAALFNTKVDMSFFQNIFKLGGTGSSSKKGVETVDTVVVGSGITGSTAAFYLHKKGVNVLLAESKDVVGGNLISKQVDGFLWEEGPNSFQPNPAILRLGKDLGMLDELVLADPTLPRFVFWEDKLYALPAGLGDLHIGLELGRSKAQFEDLMLDRSPVQLAMGWWRDAMCEGNQQRKQGLKRTPQDHYKHYDAYNLFYLSIHCKESLPLQ